MNPIPDQVMQRVDDLCEKEEHLYPGLLPYDVAVQIWSDTQPDEDACVAAIVQEIRNIPLVLDNPG